MIFSLHFFLIFIKIIINIFKKKLIRVPDFELGFGIFKFWSNFWGWGTSLLFSQPTHLLHQFWTLSSTSIPWIDYARCGIGLPPMRGDGAIVIWCKKGWISKDTTDMNTGDKIGRSIGQIPRIIGCFCSRDSGSVRFNWQGLQNQYKPKQIRHHFVEFILWKYSFTHGMV